MKDPLQEITNFLKINDHIATAGQPTAEQMSLIYDAGTQVVINLALIDSPNAVADEEKIFTEMGLKYIHIPVVWENPQKSDLDLFYAAMQKFADKKIFIHCVLNMRVSAFLTLYRCCILHEDQKNVLLDLEKIWKPDGVWKIFMQDNGLY